MGRIRSLASLTKAVEYATARQAYYSTPRPGKTTIDPNPKDSYFYTCSNYKIGTAFAVLSVQASVSSVVAFGGVTALNLTDNTAPPKDGAGRPPRGIKLARIHGMIGADAPVVNTSPVSGRRVVKYSASSTGGAKANFTAPLGNAGAAAVTPQSTFDAIVTAKAAGFKTNGYGRLWFTPEYLPISG